MHTLLSSSVEHPSWCTQDPSYLDGDLEEGRVAVIQELGESIFEVSVQFFLDNIFPPLRPEFDLDRVIQTLKDQNNISQSGRWRSFPVNPAASWSNENVTFKPLEDMVRQIAMAGGLGGNGRLLDFENNPNHTPKSELRDSTSRPDGYLILHDKQDGVHWTDIALCAEYKKRKSIDDRNDNVRKIVWGMHHCMRNDPRRRFTIGLTIEDMDTRLWFCSRSETLVTDPFNFTTDHKTVVHIFLSLMYAASHEVGWDPTICPVTDSEGKVLLDSDGKRRFDITVRSADGTNVVYRTIKILADFGANAPQGRGTRVWEAKKLENGEECGEPVALKDSWIDSDRTREGALYGELRASDTSTDFQDAMKTFIMTVICEGDVYINGEIDDTRTLMTRGQGIPKNSSHFTVQLTWPPAAKLSQSSRVTTGYHHSPEEYMWKLPDPPRVYHPKAHYRIVFKEVCKPIYTVPSLATVFQLIAQVIRGLRFLHRNKWVHRDISVGNILVDKASNVRLGDLEYLKRMDQDGAHDIRTGTADFIAIEIDGRTYKFMSEQDDTDDTDDSSTPPPEPIESSEAIDAVAESSLPDPNVADWEPETQVKQKPGVRYNPLHDLESCWWVAVYFLFNYRVVRVGNSAPSSDYDRKLEGQMRYAKRLFYGDLASRISTLTDVGVFIDAVGNLHSSVKGTGVMLEDARKRLIKRYREGEKDLATLNHTVADGIHAKIEKQFIEKSKILSAKNVEIGPFRGVERKATSKRRREDADGGDGKEDVQAEDVEPTGSAVAPLKHSSSSKKPRLSSDP
ncbi:hypothetical protein AcV7_007226 [Taiwanofungus camphoratus]|nr:hypothetical protein AcW2_005613 [Antrodia cinnamomea]KAI0953799.1 hypothetical protein AcV7_007226 [Antrodia cinnamomea]